MPTPPQTYQIIIHLRRTVQIKIGALGKHDFPAGIYCYTGSAKRNIESRLARHQRHDKPTRWHIDYLTNHPQASVIKTATFNKDECRLNQATAGEIIVNRFGASDCRLGCGAHLKYLGTTAP